MDTTYLTIEKLKKITAISKNVDVSLLENNIETSEELNIVPILGTALNSQLISEIEAGTLSGNNLTLVDSYIIPCSAYFAWYDASIFLWAKTMNKGIVKQHSDSSDALDKEELILYRQSIKDKAFGYQSRLIKYLENNINLYPNFRVNLDDMQYKTKGNSSGIFLGSAIKTRNNYFGDFN